MKLSDLHVIPFNASPKKLETYFEIIHHIKVLHSPKVSHVTYDMLYLHSLQPRSC